MKPRIIAIPVGTQRIEGINLHYNAEAKRLAFIFAASKSADQTKVIVARVISGVLFLLLGTVMAMSCICQYARSKRKRDRAGNEETLT